jgi:alpha-glucoside transport system permease protein
VVVTTLIVLVMKVYDIVKVMTNGNFGTQVLANDMFHRAFFSSGTPAGAALAVSDLRLGAAGHDLQHPPHAEGG